MSSRGLDPATRLAEMQASLDVALRALTEAQNQVEVLSRAGHHDAAEKGAMQIRGAMEAWARLLDALERRVTSRHAREADGEVREQLAPKRTRAAAG